jgi:hypothetical protein
MTLRSARTEYLLELTQKLDDLARDTQSLRDEVQRSSATDWTRTPEARAQDITQDEQRAFEAVRSGASHLLELVQKTVGELDTLLDKR